MNHERTRLPRIGLPLLASLLLAGAARGATANTYYVNGANGGNAAPPYTNWATASTTIQAAVNQAEAAFGPGTNCTVLVTNGPYLVSAPVTIGKAITVRGFAGRGAVINGGGVTRCVTINATGAVFDGFTVSNGYITTPTLQGAGIHVTGGTVRNCTITHNVAHQASATAGYLGVGVYAGSAMVTNCLILQNSCLVGSTAARGGGLYGASASLFTDCVVSGNVSRAAGGVYLGGASICRDSEIIYNQQSGSGSGGGGYSMSGVFENCLVMGNEASGAGPGLFASRQEDTVRNCTIVGNKSASGTTAGLHMGTDGKLAVVFNTIAWGNQAGGIGKDMLGTNRVSFSCAPELENNVLGNITANPGFTDWDAGHGYGLTHVRGDYHLALGSPCIDRGTATGAPLRDREGEPRPTDGDNDGVASFDMGCYEAPDATSGPLAAGFSSIPNVGVAPLQVVFNASLVGDTTGSRHQWIFGDGSTQNWSAAAMATHVYAAGAVPYQVILNVTNAGGETASATNAVTVYPLVTHVSPSGGHQAPFENWAKAATNIQDAIDAAGDGYTTTVLVSNGTYRLTASLDIGKSITVESVHGREVTFIDGGLPANTNRCVYMYAPAGCTLRGFTVSNGYAVGAAPGNRGGGIYCHKGTVRECTVTQNRGGGSAPYGAGLFASSATVRDCTVSRNLHDAGSGSSVGGGIYASSSWVTNCMILENGDGLTTYQAGGLYLNEYQAINCKIRGNQSKYQGGAHISNGEIWNSEISFNVAGVGGDTGGMVLWYGSGYNCLVIGNESKGALGVVEVLRAGSAEMHNCTVVGTRSASGAGGVQAQTYSGAFALIHNSIIYGNRSGSVASDIGGYTNQVISSCSPKLEEGVNGNTAADPQFANPGSGYGLTHVQGDYHLLKGSPCANTGAYLSWMNGAADVEGEPRIRDGAVNMGAYERLILPAGTLLYLR